MNKLMKFVYSAVITVIAGAAASYFTRFGIYNWYAALDKPTITPPDAVFPIVWTILYLLMIIAFYRVLTKADAERQRRANQLFLGQLLLQVVWTYFFFTQGYIGLAFAVIILLDLIVYKMILNCKAADKAAAYMMYPYFWWLIYASFLNFSFTYINGMVVIF